MLLSSLLPLFACGFIVGAYPQNSPTRGASIPLKTRHWNDLSDEERRNWFLWQKHNILRKYKATTGKHKRSSTGSLQLTDFNIDFTYSGNINIGTPSKCGSTMELIYVPFTHLVTQGKSFGVILDTYVSKRGTHSCPDLVLITAFLCLAVPLTSGLHLHNATAGAKMSKIPMIPPNPLRLKTQETQFIFSMVLVMSLEICECLSGTVIPSSLFNTRYVPGSGTETVSFGGFSVTKQAFGVMTQLSSGIINPGVNLCVFLC